MPQQLHTLFANRYDLQQRIGIGAFAEVWRALDTLTSREVAIKIFAPDKGIDDSGIDIFKKEYLNAFELYHPHLLRIDYFDVYNGSPYLVMPFCKQGSLMRKLQNGYEYTERDMATITMQMADALMYLHGKHFFHRDVKPDNILIIGDNHYVLSDFGISTGMRRTLERTVGYDNSKFFTGAFAPPEYFEGADLQAKSDIFSFGVTLYELACGNLPYPEMGQAVKNNYLLPDLPQPQFSRAFNTLVKNCLKLNLAERPEATDLYQWAKFYLNNGYWDIHNIGLYAPPPPITNNAGEEFTNLLPAYQNAAQTVPPPPPPLPQPAAGSNRSFNFLPFIAGAGALLLLTAAVLLWWYKPWNNAGIAQVISGQIPDYNQLTTADPQAGSALVDYLFNNRNKTAKSGLPGNNTYHAFNDLVLLPNTDSISNFQIVSYHINNVKEKYLVCLLRPKKQPTDARLIALPLQDKAVPMLETNCPNCTNIKLLPAGSNITLLNKDKKKQKFSPADVSVLVTAPNSNFLIFNQKNKLRYWKWDLP